MCVCVDFVQLAGHHCRSLAPPIDNKKLQRRILDKIY